MQKVVRSEISLIHGFVETPKGYEINRKKIKNIIIDSYVNQKRISNNKLDYSYNDYEVEYCLELQWLLDYIRDHFNEKYCKSLVLKNKWGNVYHYNQKSFTRHTVDPVDLKNSPDYTFIYAVDVGKDSSGVVIEFDDNRRKNRSWHLKLNNNEFVLFPSEQKYFITPNKSKQLNVWLTNTYEFI